MARPASDIAVPALRLLLACLLMIAAPAFLGMKQLPIAWLAVPGAALTFLSCWLQGYRRPRLVALCAASLVPVLVALYGAAFVGPWLLAAT